MIVSVHGVLEAVGPDWVHLRIGGVTLQVFVPTASIDQLGPIGEPVSLQTHLRIRDEQPVLYGFTSAAAMDFFVLLNGVSGVGPRISLAMLSSLGVTGLQQAIATEDITALTSAQGVGRRTAGRIILELKGKLDGVSFSEFEAVSADAGGDSDVIAALTALGYSVNEARQAVGNLDGGPGLALEDRIRLALQQFAGTG